jgi:nitrate/TMAO reductase-like tetraheme cytochrome c subunit
LHSRRGLFIVFLLIAGTGSAMTVGAVMAISYTDSVAFCSQCHLMAPEVQAHNASPHRDVACTDCHTEPGLAGWIKAKINGTRQLIEVITGSAPKPVPAPDHGVLPSTSVTCLRCHNLTPLLANGGPIQLLVHNRYALDAASTRETVALVVRPNGFGSQGTQVGVHWHIASDVEFLAADIQSQKIDYVTVTRSDGTVEQFISARDVTQQDNVGPDIARLEAADRTRRMDCIDCHNRVGHEAPSLDDAIDAQIDAGSISTALPDIKQLAVDRLSADYTSQAEADQAIADIHHYYTTRYPLVATGQAAQIDSAISSLQGVYRLLAVPDIGVGVSTYPNNIGHQNSPGCFRCHDGAHYKVVDGQVTDETIPSQCSTCHTFPQIGPNESAVLIGQRPSTHDDRLWIFDHKLSVTSADPTGQTCGACHTPTYCENCHATTAVQVSHDSMVTNHATVIDQVGAQACAFCHAPAYCAQCHADQVMPLGPAGSGQSVVVLPDEDRVAVGPP